MTDTICEIRGQGAEIPFSPPKKYSCNNFTECSVKVKIEAFKKNINFNFICVKVYIIHITK